MFMSDAATRLCTNCGLCCNGVLFDLVRLQPQDSVQELTRLGMKLRRKKTQPWFPQPCQFLKNCTCTIYEHRPTRCRLFECHQLKRLRSGQTQEEDVLRMIAKAKALVAELEAFLPDEDPATQSISLEERVKAAFDETTASDVKQLHLQLKRLLDREFRLLD
jgi:Fe-S-cluster containining protein